MNRDGRVLVQFPHPGLEHNPPANDMPWNVREHRRKFLIAPGRYVDEDSELGEADLVFWGEWEPPSRIERRWPRSGRMPRALHRPYWFEPATTDRRQNTDPWIWGERMIYSNCRQLTGPDGRPTSMQRLSRGSVICFGSGLDGEFCLDTVFVVASSESWVPAEAADLGVDEAFRICTGDSINDPRHAFHTFTLYRGATIEDPVEGMFSYVPARRADDPETRFCRPPVRAPGLINPRNWRSTWGSNRPLPNAVVADAWNDVRDQVLREGLLLAVEIQTPPYVDDAKPS